MKEYIIQTRNSGVWDDSSSHELFDDAFEDAKRLRKDWAPVRVVSREQVTVAEFR